MNFIPTQINGCYTLESEFIKDKRGYFMISFKENTLKKGVHQDVHFVQNYQCFSTTGVLRGVHCQTEIHTQENKLICDKNLILRALENEKKYGSSCNGCEWTIGTIIAIYRCELS